MQYAVSIPLPRLQAGKMGRVALEGPSPINHFNLELWGESKQAISDYLAELEKTVHKAREQVLNG